MIVARTRESIQPMTENTIASRRFIINSLSKFIRLHAKSPKSAAIFTAQHVFFVHVQSAEMDLTVERNYEKDPAVA